MLFPSATQKFVAALPIVAFPIALSDELFECMESYATLHDISAIAAYNPSGFLSVSKIRYLLFALEAHFNEFYIFCQRLDSFLTRLDKAYRRSAVRVALQTQLDSTRRLVAHERSSIVAIRGKHVHQRRYFDRTSLLRRMSLDAIRHPSDYLPSDRKQWKHMKVVELRRVRQRNHAALCLLKIAFVGINRVLLSSSGTIIPP
jgi:hypothetical protein